MSCISTDKFEQEDIPAGKVREQMAQRSTGSAEKGPFLRERMEVVTKCILPREPETGRSAILSKNHPCVSITYRKGKPQAGPNGYSGRGGLT